ncbi:hypothetical protein FGE12_28435 [Aggregicoccus sp. 17bor-14]|uniref:hypothetical protein n=1 Tax=Myxococcaceae TaxID=31 RepID=UPI00129D13D7|nr:MULTISPECIES: hypothetical protein [Myxococcaceae]MBF5046377.1 hypothetical protein [Simulacricoccus sp. 17bor-14]MRI92097.1 hypothetical protein [Aggregicoccus sp. 17bor-14]
MNRSLVAALLTLATSPALAQTSEPSTPSSAQPAAPAQATPPPPEAGQVTSTTSQAEKKPQEASGSWIDRVKLSGKSYLRYSYDLRGPTENANSFGIDRLYLQSEFQLTKTVRFQATLEGGDLRQGGNQYFDVTTKYAFLEVKDLWHTGSFLRVGQLPLAWISYEEDLWGYRVTGPVAVDRWGYLTSSDLGLAVGGTIPGKYGSYQVNVNNGEGWKSAELGKRKELQGRLTLNPLAGMGGAAAGLFVTGYASTGKYDDAKGISNTKERAIGQVGYQSAPLTVAAEYFAGRDANDKVTRFTVNPAEPTVKSRGVSAFAVLNLGLLGAGPVANVDLLARYDNIDPDTTLDGNNVKLGLAGVGYKWSKSIKSVVEIERTTYGAATLKPNETRGKLLAEVKF